MRFLKQLSRCFAGGTCPGFREAQATVSPVMADDGSSNPNLPNERRITRRPGCEKTNCETRETVTLQNAGDRVCKSRKSGEGKANLKQLSKTYANEEAGMRLFLVLDPVESIERNDCVKQDDFSKKSEIALSVRIFGSDASDFASLN